MVRIDCLIFGYRKLIVSPEDLHNLTSIFIRSSVYSKINSNGSIIVRERDISKIKNLLSGRIKYELSEPLGLYGKWITLKYKRMYLVALFISALLMIILSSLVWDVRIEGNENLTDGEIKMMLSESGCKIGDFWRSIDKGQVETQMLETENKLAWININRRGVVAYVSVIEKDSFDQSKNDASRGYSNIIATENCVIEEITVTRGIAMVKPGDSVKAGDILIAGVMSDEIGGDFCDAEGHIIGRISETVSVAVDRKFDNTINQRQKPYSCNINLFNFSINIFKKYGKTIDECDIIEKEMTFSLFNKCRLPFSLTVGYIPEYVITTDYYTDDELVFVATERLNSLIAAKLVSSDLVRIKTYGSFTANGYIMSSDMVYHIEVGEKSYFDVG